MNKAENTLSPTILWKDITLLWMIFEDFFKIVYYSEITLTPVKDGPPNW